MKNSYLNQPMSRYLADLSSNSMAPGGGSAAALTASLALSLIEMTARINMNRDLKKTGRLSSALQKNLKQISKTRLYFQRCVTEDGRIFQKEAKNFKHPIESQKFQSALANCLALPLAMAEKCAQSTSLVEKEFERTSQWLISDLYESFVLLEAAFDSACLNVEANLRSFQDKKKVQKIKNHLQKMKQVFEQYKSSSGSCQGGSCCG